MIKIHASQRNKQFMKDLEQNNFPVQKKKKKKSPKELGKFKLLKIQKIARGFSHELEWKIVKERVFTLRKCLHIHKAKVYIPYCKSIEYHN